MPPSVMNKKRKGVSTNMMTASPKANPDIVKAFGIRFELRHRRELEKHMPFRLPAIIVMPPPSAPKVSFNVKNDAAINRQPVTLTRLEASQICTDLLHAPHNIMQNEKMIISPRKIYVHGRAPWNVILTPHWQAALR